ncbi:hypothetical protein A2125_02240 [Candidatus Woesebacteria bacterium GWB1_43_5]|uniref:Uncharacterized protein n=1 Tax=Candidatus Woesebacteria bacterium GWB1_43_5 TaxID=1802474 RepID=A0A1F7WS09_9BACT|nr:MAG: hypothetical protein A2125_02240 [Candidatus Woesebacteria bacterium GWB1_43_5]
MAELYTRRGTGSLKKQAAVGTPVIPNTYFKFNSEDISVDFPYVSLEHVAGNRANMMEVADGKIPAPAGSIDLNVEPKTFGHFLNGLCGLTSGTYVVVSNIVGTFNTTGLVTFVGSGATATPTYIGDNYILFGTITGTPVNTDTLSQAGSGATADVDTYESGTIGHASKLPANLSTYYSLQFNYVDSAIRYFDVIISGMELLQTNNVLNAKLSIKALGVFRHAKVTAVTSSGAGSKTITVDQTLGLLATDTIKLYRPGTGFQDFSAASTLTHTVDSITDSLNFVVTNLQTATAVGDLIELAPQTATYSTVTPFTWDGGSEVQAGDAYASLASEKIEDYDFTIENDWEERFAAEGPDFEDRFPSAFLQKGVIGSGTVKRYYEDEDFMRKLRQNAVSAVKLTSQAAIISAVLRYRLEVFFPQVQLEQYDTNLTVDDIMPEELAFTAFYNSTRATIFEILLVNNVASY